MLTDEDINLNEDQLLDNLDDTNGDVDLEVYIQFDKNNNNKLPHNVNNILS